MRSGKGIELRHDAFLTIFVLLLDKSSLYLVGCFKYLHLQLSLLVQAKARVGGDGCNVEDGISVLH